MKNQVLSIFIFPKILPPYPLNTGQAILAVNFIFKVIAPFQIVAEKAEKPLCPRNMELRRLVEGQKLQKPKPGLGDRARTWGQSSNLGTELVFRDRARFRGQSSVSGTELGFGDRARTWGQSSLLGTEPGCGDRARFQGQSLLLGTELAFGDRARLRGQSSNLGTELVFGDRARSRGQSSRRGKNPRLPDRRPSNHYRIAETRRSLD